MSTQSTPTGENYRPDGDVHKTVYGMKPMTRDELEAAHIQALYDDVTANPRQPVREKTDPARRWAGEPAPAPKQSLFTRLRTMADQIKAPSPQVEQNSALSKAMRSNFDKPAEHQHTKDDGLSL